MYNNLKKKILYHNVYGIIFHILFTIKKERHTV